MKIDLLRIGHRLRSNSAKTLVFFASGNFLALMIGSLSTLVYAKWIEPEVLGEFKKYGILVSYLGIFLVFFDAGYRRNYVYLLGKADYEGARSVSAASKFLYFVYTVFGSLVFIILGIWSYFEREWMVAVGWWAQLPIFALSIYGVYLKALYRTNENFNRLNRSNIYTSLAGLILLPLLYFYGFLGFACRAFIQSGINLLYLIKQAPKKVLMLFDKKMTLNLMSISLPLQIPVLLDNYMLMPTMQLIIIKRLGEGELGIYMMAMTLLTMLTSFSSSVNQFFITKSVLNFGKHDSVILGLRYLLKPVAMASVVMLVVTIIFFMSMTWFFVSYAANYSASLHVLKYLSIQPIIIILSAPFVIFNTSLMYTPRIIMALLRVLSTLGVAWLLPTSVVNIAISLLVGRFVHLGLGYLFLYQAVRKERVRKNSV